MTDERLLIIDDERRFGDFVRRVGETCGFEALVTDNPKIFLETASNWRPTMIVLDLHMPGIDGVELLRGLAEAKCTASILILSGADIGLLGSIQQLARAWDLNLFGAVGKPIRAAELKTILLRMRTLSIAATIDQEDPADELGLRAAWALTADDIVDSEQTARSAQ